MRGELKHDSKSGERRRERTVEKWSVKKARRGLKGSSEGTRHSLTFDQGVKLWSRQESQNRLIFWETEKQRSPFFCSESVYRAEDGLQNQQDAWGNYDPHCKPSTRTPEQSVWMRVGSTEQCIHDVLYLSQIYIPTSLKHVQTFHLIPC